MSDEQATHGAGEGNSSRRDHTLQLVEFGLYFALIYTVIGSVYAFCNADVIAHLETLFKPGLTIFADLLALGTAIALWPILLLASVVCGSATCGVV